jgi:hypothetical protein
VERAGRVVVPTVTLDPIALNLGPLVAPYRKHGRLSLRIERMPQQSRLSGGRNNGNNSWSLSLDELDGLTFIPPEGMEQIPPLALRIIGVEQGGETIALLDLAVGAQGAMAVRQSADPIATQQLRRLQEELAGVKAQLAEREAELVQRSGGEAAPGPAASRKQIDAELATARAAMKAELDEKLAAASALAAGNLERARKAFEVELNARLATVEDKERERRLEARDLWKREAHQALAEAEAAWKVQEEARLALVEKKWRQEAAQAKGISADAQRLAAEIASLRASLSARDADVAKLKAAADLERDTAEAELRKTHGDLATAQATINARDGEIAQLKLGAQRTQSEETARLERELMRLRSTLTARDGEIAQLKSGAEVRQNETLAQSERDLSQMRGTLAARDSEIAELKMAAQRGQSDLAAQHAQELGKLRGALGEREREIAELKTAAQRSQSDVAAQYEQELGKVRASLSSKEQEIAAFKAAAQQAQDESAARYEQQLGQVRGALSARELEITQLRATAEQRRTQDDAERARAGVELAQVRGALAARDGELAQLKLGLEQVRSDAARELRDALANARTQWQTEESARLGAAEATWKEQSARTVADAVSKARAEAETTKSSNEEVERLRGELSIAQLALASHDGEIERVRAEGVHDKERALAAAEVEWRNAESTRYAAVENEWRARLSEARAGMPEGAPVGPASTGDPAELERARADLAAMRAAVTESAKAFEQYRAEAEAARERAKNDAEGAMLRAESDWKSSEVSRLQRAEAKGREDSAAELAEAVRRYQTAEAALAQRVPAARPRNDEQNAQLRAELLSLHQALAERDNELAYARASLDQRGVRAVGDGPSTKSAAERDAARRRRAAGGFMIQVAVTVGLVLATFVYYPHIVALLPLEWQQNISTVTTTVSQAIGQGDTRVAAAPPAATSSVPVRSATVTHGAKLRSAASSKSKALTVLPKGASVAILQAQGNWTEVRAEGGMQGWVFGPYLADDAVAEKKPAAKK